jgi:hypothetical protein
MTPEQVPERPAATRAPSVARQPAATGQPAPGGRPLFALRGREDTDVGWGDRPDSDDDRLDAERPPHWEPA